MLASGALLDLVMVFLVATGTAPLFSAVMLCGLVSLASLLATVLALGRRTS